MYMLFAEALFFESMFLVVCLFITFFLLSFQYVFKRQENVFSVFSIFIQINCFLFAQLYGFKNIFESAKLLDYYIITAINFDMSQAANDFIHIGGGTFNEIFIISKIYDYVCIALLQ